MDFSQDDSQAAVAELAAEVLGREVHTDGIDAAYRGELGYLEAAWKALDQAGLLGLAVPERLGGAGLGVRETAIVLGAVGRHAAPVPALSSLAMGVLPLARLGTRTQQQQHLGRPEVFTAALREPSITDPERCRSRAEPTGTDGRAGDGLVVSGTKIGVPYADSARRILFPVHIDGSGRGVLLLDPTATGITLTRTPSSSGAPEFTVRAAGVRASRDELLGGDDTGQAVAELHRLAVAGTCAVADGALSAALELTAEHLRTREQFGKPLATFQAAAQQIADVYICARALRLATSSACRRLSVGDDAGEDLDVAAYWLTEEVPAALHTCHHLHGGIGVDTTYPMHRYSTMIKDLARLLGGTGARVDRLAPDVRAEHDVVAS